MIVSGMASAEALAPISVLRVVVIAHCPPLVAVTARFGGGTEPKRERQPNSGPAIAKSYHEWRGRAAPRVMRVKGAADRLARSPVAREERDFSARRAAVRAAEVRLR
jgi:hypothetical protein